MSEIDSVDRADFLAMGLSVLEKRQQIYEDYLRAARRRQRAGKAFAVSTLAAAGLAMGHYNVERQNPGWRVITDMGAIAVAVVGGLIGEARADEQKKSAAAEAAQAVKQARWMGIDPPSWANQGVRLGDKYIRFKNKSTQSG